MNKRKRRICYFAGPLLSSQFIYIFALRFPIVVLLHDRESIVDVQFAVTSNDSELDRAEARSARSTPCLCGYRAGRRLRNEDVDACEGRKKERKKKKIENAEKRLFSSKNDSRKEFSCIFDRNCTSYNRKITYYLYEHPPKGLHCTNSPLLWTTHTGT